MLITLAIRNLNRHRVRAILSVLAVMSGVSMTLASDMLGGALFNAIAQSEQAQTFMVGLLDQLDMMMRGIGIAISLTGGFLILNALMMSISQRRREIGMLRALGMTRGQALRVIVAEAALIAGIGTTAGLILGPLTSGGLIALMRALTNDIFIFRVGTPTLTGIVLALALGLGAPVVAAVIPAWQAARITPLSALRARAASGIVDRAGKHTRLGAALTGSALAATFIAPPANWAGLGGDALIMGLLLFAWIAGIILMTPALIGAAGERLRGTLTRLMGGAGRITSDNFRRERSRVMVTVLTLALTLTLIVSLSSFINFFFKEYFMPTFLSSARLGAWMLMTFDVAQGMSTYSDLADLTLPAESVEALHAAFDDRAYLMDVHFINPPEFSTLGERYFSIVVDPRMVQASGGLLFDFSEGDWETALPIMESGCGVLTLPYVAETNGAEIGESFEVSGKNGPTKCTVAGLGAPFVNATIVSAAAGADFGVGQPTIILTWPKPGTNRETLGAELEAFAEANPPVQANLLNTLFEAQLSVIDIIPVMFNMMLLLAVIVAALGVVNTTMINAAERRNEFGLMRSVGATRGQMRTLIMGEGALIGLAGGMIGFIVGAGFTLILVFCIGSESRGFVKLDMWAAAGRSLRAVLPIGALGLLSFPVICAGAAWLPVREPLHQPPIQMVERQR